MDCDRELSGVMQTEMVPVSPGWSDWVGGDDDEEEEKAAVGVKVFQV